MIRKRLLKIQEEIDVMLLEAGEGDVVPKDNIIYANVKGFENSPIAVAFKAFKEAVLGLMNAASKIVETIANIFKFHMEAEATVDPNTKTFLNKIIALVKKAIETLSGLIKNHSTASTSMFIGFSMSAVIVTVAYGVAYAYKNNSNFIADEAKTISDVINKIGNEIKNEYASLLDEKEGPLHKRVYKFLKVVVAAPFMYIYEVAKVKESKGAYSLGAVANAMFLSIGVGLAALIYIYQKGQ